MIIYEAIGGETTLVNLRKAIQTRGKTVIVRKKKMIRSVLCMKKMPSRYVDMFECQGSALSFHAEDWHANCSVSREGESFFVIFKCLMISS